MEVSGIASGRVSAAYTPPSVASPQAKAPQKSLTADMVSISKQAQQLATDGDTKAQEVRESGANKASETSRGKV